MHVLITGAWQDAQGHFAELKAIGHEIVFMQQEKDELPCDPVWVEGVICNGLFLHHPIENFPNLRFIQLTSAGYDRVDMGYVKAHEIEIHNAKGVYSISMAEYAVAGVLQLYKQCRFFYENQKAHRWEKHRGLLELNGKTVLIVGCGDVGTGCARRFRAFGCKVIGLNRTLRDNSTFDEIHSLAELDAVLPEADVIILTLGLSTETNHILNAKRLKGLKSGAVLVNLARGGLIDEEALLPELQRLSGAVLDVFEQEPLLASSPLWERKNVILTPHNSFVSEGNGERMAQVILDTLRKEAII